MGCMWLMQGSNGSREAEIGLVVFSRRRGWS